MVRAATREYREAMARFAEMRNIDVWYTRLDVAAILEQLGASVSRKQMKRLEANVAKARTKDSMRALAKLCGTVDGELRIVGDAPLVTPIEDVLPSAEQDHLEDVVRRMIRTYTTHAAARPAQPARELSVRACRSEGRRGRQRGYPLPGSC